MSWRINPNLKLKNKSEIKNKFENKLKVHASASMSIIFDYQKAMTKLTDLIPGSKLGLRVNFAAKV